jgi:tRNA(adenine34) deaminase
MWEQIPLPWQLAMNQAWIAYCAGSLPIGAVIMSPEGELIAEGRNRLSDEEPDGDPQHFRKHFMAHAEQNAFISLGILRGRNPEIKSKLADYILYTTLEPCDMCLGTLIQSGIKKVHFLIPDPVGGAIDSLTATPHVQAKHITAQGPQPGVEANIALALFVVSMAQVGIALPDDILTLFRPYSSGLELGKSLVRSHQLEQFCAQKLSILSVYNQLAQQLPE